MRPIAPGCMRDSCIVMKSTASSACASLNRPITTNRVQDDKSPQCRRQQQGHCASCAIHPLRARAAGHRPFGCAGHRLRCAAAFIAGTCAVRRRALLAQPGALPSARRATRAVRISTRAQEWRPRPDPGSRYRSGDEVRGRTWTGWMSRTRCIRRRPGRSACSMWSTATAWKSSAAAMTCSRTRPGSPQNH